MNTAQTAAESRQESRTTLRDVELILTTRCNLACSYCYQEPRRPRDMPWRVVRAAIDSLLATGPGPTSLGFYGGEPLLCFATLRRAVEYSERRRERDTFVEYYVTTNGTLVTPRLADFLDRRHIKVQLSLDGIRQAQDSRAPGTFDRLAALLADLHTRHRWWLRECFAVGLTVTAANVAHLVRSVRWLIEAGVRTIRIGPLVTFDAGWDQDATNRLDEAFAELYRLCLRQCRECGNVPLTVFRRDATGDATAQDDGALCGACDGKSVVVDVDGNVTGCPVLVASVQRCESTLLRSVAQRLQLGRIDGKGVPRDLVRHRARLLAEPLFTDKRSKSAPGRACGDCRWLATCAVCPVSIAHQPGNADPHRVPEHQCAFQRVACRWRHAFPPQQTPTQIVLEAAERAQRRTRA